MPGALAEIPEPTPACALSGIISPRCARPRQLTQSPDSPASNGAARAATPSVEQRPTVVLGIASCGAGQPRWWISDGPLVPRRCPGAVRSICREIASGEPALGLEAHRGRGATPALPARSKRIPGTTIGCLDERGLAPRSHLPSDLPESIDPRALDSTVQLALILVEAIDAYVGRVTEPAPQVTPA